ncbi:unnamed protein product, partial [Prorocentrum cordatum]
MRKSLAERLATFAKVTTELSERHVRCKCWGDDWQTRQAEHWVLWNDHLTQSRHTRWRASVDAPLDSDEERQWKEEFRSVEDNCNSHRQALREAQQQHGEDWQKTVKEKALAAPAAAAPPPPQPSAPRVVQPPAQPAA